MSSLILYVRINIMQYYLHYPTADTDDDIPILIERHHVRERRYCDTWDMSATYRVVVDFDMDDREFKRQILVNGGIPINVGFDSGRMNQYVVSNENTIQLF